MSKFIFEPGEVIAHQLPDGHIALVLPPKAAQTLVDLMAQIGGSPETTRRKWTDLVSVALHACGYDWRSRDVHGRRKHDDDISTGLNGCNFTENLEGV